MTSTSTKTSPLKCYHCGGEIKGGYFTTFVKGVRKDYHPRCQPRFFYIERRAPCGKQ